MVTTKLDISQVQPRDVIVADGVNYLDGDFVVTNYANAAACIQAAINAVKTIGGKIHIRAGTYNIGTTISFSGATQPIEIYGDLIGANSAGTRLHQVADVTVFDIPLNIYDITLRNMFIDAQAAYVSSFINMLSCEFVTLKSLHLRDFTGNALVKHLIHAEGSVTDSATNITIVDCLLELSSKLSTGIFCYKYVTTSTIQNNQIYSQDTAGRYGRYGIYFSDGGIDDEMGTVIKIIGNRIGLQSDNQGGDAVVLSGLYRYLTIANNSMGISNDGTIGVAGLYLYKGSRTTSFYHHSTITGNWISASNGFAGTRAVSIDYSGLSVTRFTFVGNMVECDSGGAGVDYCAYFRGVGRCIVDANVFEGGDVDSLYFDASCSFMTVGVNYCSRQQQTYADPTNSYNVQDQIVKAWGNFNNDATIRDSYNVASGSDPGIGHYIIVWDRDFLNNAYSIVATPGIGALVAVFCSYDNILTGQVDIYVYNSAGGVTDSDFSVMASGASAD